MVRALQAQRLRGHQTVNHDLSVSAVAATSSTGDARRASVKMRKRRGRPADITSSFTSRRNRSARHSQIPFATPCRADDGTSMHHTRFFRTYVMASTTNQIGCRILPVAVESKGD
jgi:hypothetical protein